MSFFRKKKKDKTTEEGGSTNKGSKKDKKKNMPLFKHQSDKGKRRQQQQELMAQQDPEPKYDLSDCDMLEVPEGVYAVCKVLHKRVLLLHDNQLRDLDGGGDLSDLVRLTVLDLHHNHFKTLPDSIGCLEHLQVLDLSHNKLKHLPEALRQLKSLQTLKLKDNRLHNFPEEVCQLPHLRTLDVSQNEIKTLPLELCRNKALETLVLDDDKMEYPSQEICEKTTSDVMQFLCKEAGVAYEHPSKYWLKDTEWVDGCSNDTGRLQMEQIESQMTNSVHAYQNALDMKRQDLENIEKTLQAEHNAQAELAAQAAERHRKLLSSINLNTEQDSQDLSELNRQKEAEKGEFLKYLQDLENGASNLLTQLLDYNKKAKETEELLEQIEVVRMKEDDSFKVRWEEIQNLRKQEVLDNMTAMLEEFSMMEAARLGVQSEHEQRATDAMEEEYLNIGTIESVMYSKGVEHKKMVEDLAKQDQLQKTAFEALLLRQDTANQRIHQQMALIEAELAQITAAEMEQRARRTEHEFCVVSDQRIALSAMLAQLLEERDKRRLELRKRLVEMEEERENGQNDYWLVQYQRLLDWKPQTLIDRESNLEIAVKEILVSAGAEEYIPVFARHRITIETMMTLTEADLSQMGVHQLGLRRAIMKNLDLQRSEAKAVYTKEENNEKETKGKSLEVQIPTHPVAPSAPRPESSLAVSFSKQLSVTARGINSECVICMDKESQIIFLTCGHVCCCAECAQPVQECPLCRANITGKIKLTIPVAQPSASSQAST